MVPPAAHHGILLQHAQAGYGLARVEHVGVGAVDGVHILAGQRGNAAQMLHQVQDHALTAQQHPRVVADDGQHAAIAHAHAVKDLGMADDLEAGLRRGARVKPGIDLQKAGNDAQAADHQLLPRQNRSRGAQVGVNGEVGGGIRGGLVFNKRLLQQCVDAAALPVHIFFPELICNCCHPERP